MNVRTLTWAVGALVTGTVLGFILATFGAGTTLAQMTAERDDTRDKLADQVKLAMDTGAELVKEARLKQMAAEQALADATPKRVKGA